MKEENDNLKFIILLLSISLLWVWSWIFIDKFVAIEQRANFGDKFGFINSLFSGLALAVIIYSIILQQKELNLQRKELSDTRQEFKDQNFQTTFFNLIKTQQQIVNEISTTIVDLKSYNQYSYYEANGRTFFMRSRIEFKRIEKALNSLARMLNIKDLEKWLQDISVNQNPKKVGLILAGNIPLVGFHDVLCVLATGNIAVIKLSSSDDKLLPALLKALVSFEPALATHIEYAERLKDFDAIIATGSNNTSRYFDYYFSKVFILK